MSVVAQTAVVTAPARGQTAAAATRLLRPETALQRERQGCGGHNPQGNLFICETSPDPRSVDSVGL